jgi:hypothetical protein
MGFVKICSKYNMERESIVKEPVWEGNKALREGVSRRRSNPILHTAWLDSHALTLKSSTAKYYFCEKSSFLHTSCNFVVNQGKFKSSSKHFTFNDISVFKKVNLNVWQTCHDLFEISSVTVWFRSHSIIHI